MLIISSLKSIVLPWCWMWGSPDFWDTAPPLCRQAIQFAVPKGRGLSQAFSVFSALPRSRASEGRRKEEKWTSKAVCSLEAGGLADTRKGFHLSPATQLPQVPCRELTCRQQLHLSASALHTPWDYQKEPTLKKGDCTSCSYSFSLQVDGI